MVDTLSKHERSKRMSLVKGKNTKPELKVRKLIYNMGYRYRLHVKNLPGTPDIVFKSRKKVIFVHGCFWHRHDHCTLARLPKSRLEFWKPKLEKNKERDALKLELLERLGWRNLVIWECQIKDDDNLKKIIHNFLQD